jgi:hypothetical protein
MRYELEETVRALNGLQEMAGESFPEQTRRNNLNVVYICLNADRHITDDDRTKLGQAIEEAKSSE